MPEDFEDWLLVAFIAAVFASIGWVSWLTIQDARSPTFELKKADWVCTHTVSRTHMQPMIVGKVTVITPITADECTQYTRATDDAKEHGE